MIRIAAIAIAFLGLLSWALWLRGAAIDARAEAAAVTRELNTARADLAMAAEANRVHRAHIKRLEAQEAEWDALSRELQSMEGRDAPLSDHLRAAAGRLWP
jgi:hypothetical protein